MSLTGAKHTKPKSAAAEISGTDIFFLAGRRSRGSYKENGQSSGEIIMTKHGWNAFRLCVFVSPVRQAPTSYLESTA
jgi:hypothetical protein